MSRRLHAFFWALASTLAMTSLVSAQPAPAGDDFFYLGNATVQQLQDQVSRRPPGQTEAQRLEALQQEYVTLRWNALKADVDKLAQLPAGCPTPCIPGKLVFFLLGILEANDSVFGQLPGGKFRTIDLLLERFLDQIGTPAQRVQALEKLAEHLHSRYGYAGDFGPVVPVAAAIANLHVRESVRSIKSAHDALGSSVTAGDADQVVKALAPHLPRDKFLVGSMYRLPPLKPGETPLEYHPRITGDSTPARQRLLAEVLLQVSDDPARRIAYLKALETHYDQFTRRAAPDDYQDPHLAAVRGLLAMAGPDAGGVRSTASADVERAVAKQVEEAVGDAVRDSLAGVGD